MPIFIERYFKKSRPEDITYDDFQQFLKLGIEENQNLEYKPRGLLVKQDDTVNKSSDPKEIAGFSALAKSVASFANSEGGLLILGVKEKPEKHKGQVVKIRPGVISALPISITREMIEANLTAKIQYPIDGITIVPLRSSSRSKKVIYLIDVPQSIRAPHRVNELYYYQRYNFTTYEMKHYQIADLFGRRLAPDLEIELIKKKGSNEEKGHFTFHPILHNKGQAVAKYVTCLCTIGDGPYKIFQSEWQVRDEGKQCQFSTGINSVVYPEVSFNTGYIEFQPLANPSTRLLTLLFGIYAEGMPGKQVAMRVEPT